MQFQNDLCEIDVIDELSSGERSMQYAKEYLLGENFSHVPFYGVIVKSFDGLENSCVISATGGNTKVHSSSAVIINENLFVAIGNLIYCLEIPSLTLQWHQQVDMATCFGVYISPDKKSIISHGEIDIAKISLSGQIEWTASGKDIFSEGFVVLSDHVEAIDFNHEKYYINISNGQVSLKHGG